MESAHLVLSQKFRFESQEGFPGGKCVGKDEAWSLTETSVQAVSFGAACQPSGPGFFIYKMGRVLVTPRDT